MRDILHEPELTAADIERLLGELALGGADVPLVAMVGPRVIAASRTFLTLFGAPDLAGLGERLQRGEPGARRLVQLAHDMPVGGAPRLERLRFFFGHSAEPLTFLCRTLMRGGERLLAAAILNVAVPDAPTAASAVGAQPEAASAPAVVSPAAQVPDTHEGLRCRLLDRFPAGRLRFTWRGDAAGRIGAWSSVFAEAVGAAAADVQDRTLSDIAAGYALDPSNRLAAALANGGSWTVAGLPWPVAGAAAAVPVDLGAVPDIAADGQVVGLRGFGIAHIDRLHPAPMRVEASSLVSVEPTQADGPAAEVAPVSTEGATILPLRRAMPLPAAVPRRLSSAEQSAFQEIALLLAGRETEEAETDASQALPSIDTPAASSEETRDLRAILDAQAVGILVGRDDQPLFANRAFRDRLGLDAACDLADAGPLSMLLHGAGIGIDDAQPLQFGGMPAHLWTLTPPPVPAPAAAPSQPPPHGESEARELAAILDTASDGVVLLDPSGRVLAINRTGEALFGYDRSEIVGQFFSMLVAPASRSAAEHYFDARTASGAKRLLNDGCEIVGLAKQGGSFPLFMTVSAFGDGERKFCALLRDMTHRRKVERDLEEARVEAERSSAAKSDFLAKVSHEIRTPLNAIIGFAEVIMDERLGPVGNERYRDYLRDIHASGTHVMSLVNDLLDLSKIDAGKMELDFQPLDLNGVVTACISMMQVQANRERVIVRHSLTSDLPRVRADERAVKQILLNLLSNALKFNEPGGQVIVATTRAEAGHAVIRIRDTGIGMTDAEIEVALEPFRTIANARTHAGTGLGLPLTKALAEANHALFAIKSRKGEGTLVEIAFPAA